MKWPMTCLGEVASLERKSLVPNEIETGTSYLGLEHIESGGRILGYQRVGAGELQSNKFMFDPGTLLYGKLRPYLAKICIPDREGCCSTDILPIRPSQKLDIGYLKHVLLWKPYIDKANSLCTGANLPRISPSSLLGIEIPLPPLEEQRRIAAILDKAHDMKAKAAKRSMMIPALARSLFVRRFGLPSENPHNLPMHRLIDICNPKQWPTISSKQLQDYGYPVFGANGLIGYFDRFNHSEPTVLVTCRGATCGTVNVSPPNCYVTGNSMAMDDPDPSLLTTDYLAWVLRLRGMYDVISGSAQPQITRQGLEAVMIPLPPIEAQSDFSNELITVSGMGKISRHSEDSVFKLANSLAGALLGGRS
jgi:restriction endonuclease S subunit